jgi:ribosome-associated toxin RatA of RatAB toxin-antitoxin module
MHAENNIFIQAPLAKVFATASDLALWPKILPHYRWVRFLERSPQGAVVNMAAKRKNIPIQWTSEYRIDADNKEMHFRHLRAFTKGMLVVWTFTPTADGVDVRIRHDLQNRIPLVGNFIAESIIGNFFIGYVANQTLLHLKLHLEGN